ncbi:hypothetical protein IT575_02760 [bacterium]|nr:hypothetical protein [bacterium]
MRLRAVMTAAAGLLLALGFRAAAFAAEPEESVRAHFAAILAEDYRGADEYFSADFLGAFKADVEDINTYYSTRREQLTAGYEVVAVDPLADAQRETMRITVDFNDPREEAVRTVTERLHYYLIREKVPGGAPGRDGEGRAWRIDIYDAISFDTLADARRRAYLGTRYAWPEDEGRELRSKQGFFRIQWALGSFGNAKGRYPLRLLGGDNRRDELISEGYLTGSYPTNGFNNEPMKLQDFGEKSSGDYSYYSLDNNGDGEPDDYWLLLHGKVPEHFYFSGHDTIYIANADMDGSQAELAARFAEFWLERSGDELSLTAAVEPAGPASALLPTNDMLEMLADARDSQLGPGQEEAALRTVAAVEGPSEAEQAAAALAAGGADDDPAAGGTELEPGYVLPPADSADTAGDAGAGESAELVADTQLQVADEAVTEAAELSADSAANESAAGDSTAGPDAGAAAAAQGGPAQGGELNHFDWLFSEGDNSGPWRIFSFGWD